MQKEIGDNISHENIREYLWKTLRGGQVVPGYVLVHLVGQLLHILQIRSWCSSQPRSSIHRPSRILQDPS